MAVKKLSQISTTGTAFASTDFLVGVQGGTTDVLFTHDQINNTVFNVQQYGWLPDGTDRSAQALALLSTVSAAGGGTMYFPPSTGTYRADSQLFIPNDGTASPVSSQKQLRMTGAGGGMIWGVLAPQAGAAVLDLRYQSTVFTGTGSITGNTLTITGVTSGTLVVGSVLRHASITGFCAITAFGTGVGGIGDYTLSSTQTVGSSTIKATDINSKIETRGSGGLQIDNLTLIDGSGNTNDTSFIHSTNTTLSIHNNIFIGSGSATQDVIILGGPVYVESDGSLALFQGYDTVINNNIFKQTNRWVWGLGAVFSTAISNNGGSSSVGTVSIELDSCSTGANRNAGNVITYNGIEMFNPHIYGVVLRGCDRTYCANLFDDHDTTAVSSYYLANASAVGTGATCKNNTVVDIFNSEQNPQPSLVTASDISFITTLSIRGANTKTNSLGVTGIAASEFAENALVKGPYAASDSFPGQLAIVDRDNPTNTLTFSMDGATGNAYINSTRTGGGGPRTLTVNGEGGAVKIGGPVFFKTAAVLGTQFDATNTSTLATVTGLEVTVPTPGNYFLRAILYVDADNTGGHKYDVFNGGAAPTSVTYQINSINNGTGGSVITSRQTAFGGAAGASGGTTIFTVIEGSFRAGNVGDLPIKIRFAQNTATPATTSSVLVDSYLEILGTV